MDDGGKCRRQDLVNERRQCPPALRRRHRCRSIAGCVARRAVEFGGAPVQSEVPALRVPEHPVPVGPWTPNRLAAGRGATFEPPRYVCSCRYRCFPSIIPNPESRSELFGLQAFDQECDQFPELFHLVRPKRSFEYLPVAARHFGVKFAKELDAFGAQANPRAATVLA